MKIITKDEISQAYKWYIEDRLTLGKIANIYCISVYRLRSALVKSYPSLKFIRKSSKVNENYFDIVGPNQAYILGLIASDGYIIDNRRERKMGQNFWGIALQERDKDILEKVRTAIKLEKELEFRKKRNKNWQASYVLTVRSNEMVKKLKKIGIGPRKSFTLDIPKVIKDDEILFWHFFRGLFDGDGCITCSTYKNKKIYKASIIGSLATCKYIAKFLFEKHRIGSGEFHSKENIYVSWISGHLALKKLKNLLYNKATIYMERKKKKFDEIP